jgi:hypothetical protein
MTADPNNPEVLVSVPSDVEAAAIVTALATRGIQASTTGDYTAGFRAEAPGQISVVVRCADLDQAKRELAEIRTDQADIDWSQVDVGEPDDRRSRQRFCRKTMLAAVRLPPGIYPEAASGSPAAAPSKGIIGLGHCPSSCSSVRGSGWQSPRRDAAVDFTGSAARVTPSAVA